MASYRAFVMNPLSLFIQKTKARRVRVSYHAIKIEFSEGDGWYTDGLWRRTGAKPKPDLTGSCSDKDSIAEMDISSDANHTSFDCGQVGTVERCGVELWGHFRIK